MRGERGGVERGGSVLVTGPAVETRSGLVATNGEPRRGGAAAPSTGVRSVLLPTLVFAFALGVWELNLRVWGDDLLPTPGAVLAAILELAARDVLVEHVVASLFRVSWGFSLAALVAVPLGLMMGWFGRVHAAFDPLLQVLRPISPIAWIPLAILWFGITDAAPIFLIFLAAFFPIVVAAASAVRTISPVQLLAARNFGLGRRAMLLRVILPASLPQIVSGLRVALGVAWMVVVAAEMIAVRSGLGFLILDARNAGKRYDLVIAAMILTGLVGYLLDRGVKSLERLAVVRWGLHAHRG